MAFGFGSVASLVRSVVPALQALRPGSLEKFQRVARAGATRSAASIGRLSAEAEAALAPLNLPPDGPFDPAMRLRAKLAPDDAASNFVRWAQALDLAGTYSRRSIYGLYCEFSEVDHRPPLRDTLFLEALTRTEGILRERHPVSANGAAAGRHWQWTIEPAGKLAVWEAHEADSTQIEVAPVPAPIVIPAPITQPLAAVEAPLAPAQAPMPAPPAIILAKPTILPARFLGDDEHPFSPASLREQEKSARRERFIAAASRKQRGALRRAA